MRFLVDAHVLLWAQFEPEKLSAQHRNLLRAPGHDIFFSAASIWEIAIKMQLGRMRFNVDPDRIAEAVIESGMCELPVRSTVAARVARLPLHHADPFDRLLIAQAIADSLTLLTADALLARCSDLVSTVTAS